MEKLTVKTSHKMLYHDGLSDSLFSHSAVTVSTQGSSSLFIIITCHFNRKKKSFSCSVISPFIIYSESITLSTSKMSWYLLSSTLMGSFLENTIVLRVFIFLS